MPSPPDAPAEGFAVALARPDQMAIVVSALLVAAALQAGPGAASAVGPPTWSPGDSWVWTWIMGTAGYTRTWTVQEQTTLDMHSGLWTVWHVAERLDLRSVLMNTTGTADLWIRPTDFGLAKEILQTDHGQYTMVWDPPVSQALFPLDDNAWTGTASVWSAIPTPTGSTTMTSTLNYSGRALPAMSASVPAGTFQVVPILFSEEGLTSTVAYYSEVVGNFVLIQDYSSGTVVRSQSLTSYHRGFTPDPLWIALGVGGAAVVLFVVFLRRRRPRPATPPPEPGGPEPAAEVRAPPTTPEERSR